MKHITQLFCLLVFWLTLPAQGNTDVSEEELLKHKVFELSVECPVYRVSIAGELLDTLWLVAPAHSKFTVIDKLGDRCIIRFQVFSRNKVLKKEFNYEDDNFMNYKYFSITKAQLMFKAKPLYRQKLSMSIGNIVSPVKIRLKPFDFSRDLMIGSTIGIRYSAPSGNGLCFNALLGIGLSNNSVDSFSTLGATSQPVEVLTFSPSLGLVFEFGNAQLGLFSGYDIMSQNTEYKKKWVYRKQPWLSFGIGFSIFSFNIKN